MPMPTVVAVGTVANGTASVVPALPAGWAADDIFVMPTESENQSIFTPTGWGLAAGGAVIVSTGVVTRLTVFWRRAVAGDTDPTVVDPGDHVVARIIAVRGCVTTGNPWNVSATATELVADTSVSVPGATTTAPDCLVLAIVSTGTDVASTAHASGWANASLGSVTEQMDNWVADGLGGGFAMASGTKAVQGLVSATTATLVTANFKALMMLALQGASASVPKWRGLPPGTKRPLAAHTASNW